MPELIVALTYREDGFGLWAMAGKPDEDSGELRVELSAGTGLDALQGPLLVDRRLVAG